jgi:hypothetical protein
MKRVTVRCLVAGIAVLVLLAGASSALAFGVTSVTVTPRAIAQGEPGFGLAGLVPADPFASGAHPALDIGIEFDNRAGGTVPDTAVTDFQSFTEHLGPGIVANPHATATCSQSDFDSEAPGFPGISSFAPLCNPSTQVGSSTVTLLIPAVDGSGNVTFQPQDFPGQVYNLAPEPGEAARLGITTVLSPPDPDNPNGSGFIIKLVAPITVDPKDFGLNTTVTDPLAAFPVEGIKLSLWGYAAPGLSGGSPQLAPFFTNPTTCAPATVSVTATSITTASDPNTGSTFLLHPQTSTNSASYTPTDCAHEPFDSSVSLAASTTSTDTPAEVTVHVDPAAPADAQRVTSYVKRTSVTLPPGMFLNPVRADGTDVCTADQFDARDRSTGTDCPASSQIGTASFVSPQLGGFSGNVYLSTGTADDVIRLFVDVPVLDGSLHVKLVGDVRPNPATGQVTTVFDNLPPTAFTDFTLKLTGGSHAGLLTPAACGTGTVTADLTPFNGQPDSTPASPFTTSFDGNGGACPNLFRPSLSASLSNPAAGQTSSYSLTFARPDRDRQFDAASINLPAGLVGNLALPGLTKCSLEAAEAGACRTSSRLGPAQVNVGPASQGSTPVTLTGDVFLTEALQPGDPAGLSVRVPAKIGAIDLGKSIIPVRLALRPDGGLTATTSLPQFQDGVPTDISSATITLDRPGFMRTPSSCGLQRYAATFTGIGGGSAAAAFTGSLSGCEKLGFAPKLSVKLNAAGATKAGAHPSLSTVLTQRVGEAAPRSVRVVLPAALSTNLKALNAACTQAAYDAGKCGSAASPGTATATSPLLSQQLGGTAYFVKTSSGKLPKLVVALRGPLSIDVTGTLNVARNGQLTTTIAAPDLPITRFALSLHGGSSGVLITNKSLCSKRFFTSVSSVGQNGKKASQRAATAIAGCTKAKPKPKRKAA